MREFDCKPDVVVKWRMDEIKAKSSKFQDEILEVCLKHGINGFMFSAMESDSSGQPHIATASSYFVWSGDDLKIAVTAMFRALLLKHRRILAQNAVSEKDLTETSPERLH